MNLKQIIAIISAVLHSPYSEDRLDAPKSIENEERSKMQSMYRAIDVLKEGFKVALLFDDYPQRIKKRVLKDYYSELKRRIAADQPLKCPHMVFQSESVKKSIADAASEVIVAADRIDHLDEVVFILAGYIDRLSSPHALDDPNDFCKQCQEARATIYILQDFIAITPTALILL
jgi:hypothetical protein